jgi:hypothetical protein
LELDRDQGGELVRWSEQHWGARVRTRALTIILLGGIGLLPMALAACDLPAQAAPSPNFYPVIHAPSPSASSTPAPLGYTVGVWPSDFTPLEGHSVTIFVAFLDASVPVAGARVTIQVQYARGWMTFGPRGTNGAGYAAFTVPSRGQPPARPVVVTATVAYQGQTYTGDSVFATMPAGAQSPKATPNPGD